METLTVLSDSLLGALVIGAIACVFMAFILRLAAGWAAHLDVPYVQAYFTTLIAFAFNAAAQVGLGVLAGMVGMAAGSEGIAIAISLTALPVSLLIDTWVFQWRLGISFGEALLITLMMIAILIVIAVLLVGAIFAWNMLG